MVVLTDTNALYKLFFFRRKNVIPAVSIAIPNIGNVEFHPIVIQELKEHIKFYKQHENDDEILKTQYFPQFLKNLSAKDITDLEEFAHKNMCRSIATVNTKSGLFTNKRSSYEKIRVRLQAEWKAQGVVAKKVRSIPTHRDYSILFSAQHHKMKILTHDEILGAVAIEILDDGCLFKVEDVIYQVLQSNAALKPQVVSALDDLNFLGEKISRNKILR